PRIMSKLRDYFKQKCEKWEIIDFLNECDIESFDFMIDSYIKSLDVIVNIGQGEEQERAKELLDRYKKASFLLTQHRYHWGMGELFVHLMFKAFVDLDPRPDYHSARKWKNERSSASGSDGFSVYINNSTFGNLVRTGSIGDLNFSNKVPKRNIDYEENDDIKERDSKKNRSQSPENESVPPTKYNLRSRKVINYSERNSLPDELDLHNLEKMIIDGSNSGISSICEDENENSSDVNSDEEFLEDLNTTNQEDTSPIIEKLLEYGEGIARYRVIFLPEDNKKDPLKTLLTSQEWVESERDWKMIEEKIVDSFSVVIPKNIQDLLTKYNKAIKKNTINFKSDASKIALVINENPFDKERTEYVFHRDWLPHWMPNDFFHDSRLSEYAYRDRIINKLWEDVFLDVYPKICMRTGEVENIDRKNQKDRSRPPKQKRAIGWSHDAILMIECMNKEVQVGFGEVIGNPCRHDDEKRDSDREKMLKAMQISLNKLRSLLSEKGISNEDLENLETFGMLVYKRDFIIYSTHWVRGLYLVDQINGFTIPDTADRLSDLSSIIHVMLEFKNYIDSLLKHKPISFGYRKTINKPAVDSSILMKSPEKNIAKGKIKWQN
ncbi:1758_t:CDS:10, partial [Acaulospora morrowiae]